VDVKNNKKRRGAAAVEFAVVAPVLIMLVFGMIEFGRAIMVQQVIVNASREGARTAVIEGASLADVNGAITAQLDAATIADRTIAFRVNGSTVSDPTVGSAGDSVSVDISVNYADITWLPSPSYLGGTQLQATSVMRREYTN
jgi:Flp pilus assembly protein TadG